MAKIIKSRKTIKNQYYPPGKKPPPQRRGETEHIGEAFRRFLDKSRFGHRYLAMSVVGAWAEVMGKSVAQRTTQVSFKDDTLFVTLNSAPLREELIFLRKQIIPKINDEVGKELVKKIRFL